MPLLRAAILTLLLAASASARTIRVGAAISLREAATQIALGYEERTGEKVELTFGSSGQLAGQVRSGAPIDLFISASPKHVDDLAKEGLADGASLRVVAGNALVLVVPAGAAAESAPRGFAELARAEVRRVAVGEPRTVPAGAYAQQVIEALKLAGPLRDRLVYGTNVRQVLDYVERGEVGAGVVYRTDARAAGDRVRVVATADPRLHEPIVYPAVIVWATTEKAAATRFLGELTGPRGRAVLVAHGFDLPPAAATQPALPPRSQATPPAASAPGQR